MCLHNSFKFLTNHSKFTTICSSFVYFHELYKTCLDQFIKQSGLVIHTLFLYTLLEFYTRFDPTAFLFSDRKYKETSRIEKNSTVEKIKLRDTLYKIMYIYV